MRAASEARYPRCGAPWLGRTLLSSILALGCSEPSTDIIARQPTDSSDASARAPLARPRGRVSVQDGRLVTDIGTPLRGLLLPLDIGWSLENFYLLEEIATKTGLNAVHVYLENWAHPTGTMQSEADALIALAAQHGLYVVLAIGGGKDAPDHPGNGWFDPEKVRSFWALYGERYKDSPHLLFEIQNNPEISCKEPLGQATIDLQRQTYALIRSVAPETHVVLFSMSSLPEPAVFDDALARVSDVVDWSNASSAMHWNTDCLPPARFPELQARAAAQDVPILISQLPIEAWEGAISSAESLGVSWLMHKYLALDPDLDALTAAVTAANLSWCPDMGSFPTEATKCQAP